MKSISSGPKPHLPFALCYQGSWPNYVDVHQRRLTSRLFILQWAQQVHEYLYEHMQLVLHNRIPHVQLLLKHIITYINLSTQ